MCVIILALRYLLLLYLSFFIIKLRLSTTSKVYDDGGDDLVG